MIWSGISKDGKTPICIEEYGFNQDEYKRILKENLIGYANTFYTDSFGHYYTTVRDAYWKRNIKMDGKKDPKCCKSYTPKLNFIFEQ